MDTFYADLGITGHGDPMRLVVAGQEFGIESDEHRRMHIGDKGTLLDGAQNTYIYGDADARVGEEAIRLNYAMGTIDTFSAMAFRTPPVITIQNKTIGDEGIWVIKKAFSATAINPANGLPMQDSPPVDPLTNQPQVGPDGISVVGQIHPPIEYKVGQVIPEVVAKTIDDEYKFHICVETAKECEQRWFDFKRDAMKLDVKLRTIPHRLQIHGWVMGLVQWNHGKQQCYVVIHEPQQWYPDPIKETVDEMNYVRLDVPTDAEEAKARYPELSDWIDLNASRSLQYEAPGQPYSSIYRRSFRRPMVTMVYVWLRNQPMLTTLDQAIASGDAAWVDDKGQPITQKPADGSEPKLIHAKKKNPDGNSIELADAYLSDGMANREHGGAKGKIHPHLPTRRGIRQWIQTNSKLATKNPTDEEKKAAQGTYAKNSDMECPWSDIPVFLVRNHPLLGRPFAVGDTERMGSLLRSITDLHISKLKHVAQFRGPMGIIAKSILDRITKGFKDGHAHPDEIAIFDDAEGALLDSFEKGFKQFNPPPLNEALPKVEAQTLQHYNEITGHSDALRGEVPAGVKSGVGLEALQSAGAMPELLKSTAIEEAIERIASLIHHAQLYWISDEEISNIDRSVPAELIPMIRKYSRSIKWGYKVDLATGAGAMKAKEEAQARADAVVRCADGEPLTSSKDVRERLGMDNDEINRDIEKSRERAMKQEMAMQSGGAPGQPGAPAATQMAGAA